MSKPVIATNYSAHTEFCNNGNCTLIDIDETEIANDGRWFAGQGNWAKLGKKQLDRLCEAMYNVYKQWQDDMLQPNLGGACTADNFSWKDTAKHIDKVLKNG